VEDDGAVGGAAHAAVADPDHVADAALQQPGRQGHVADLRHARVALGAAAPQDQHGGLIDLEGRVVEAGVEVLDAVEHHRPAPVPQQAG
jgi:hypothetical protein